MVICFFLDSHWSANLGGAELQVKYLMEECRKRGHKLYYLCRRNNPEHNGAETIKSIKKVPLLSKYVHFVDYWDALNQLKEIKPDLIYTRVDLPYVGFAAHYCKTRLCKTVWHIAHERDVSKYKIDSRRKFAKWVDREIFEYGVRNANVIIGQAEYQDALLKRHYGRSCEAVVPNFHPVPKERIRKSDNIVSVLWLANLKPFKRPELFLRVAERFADYANVRFIMVGALQDSRYLRLIRCTTIAVPNLRYLGFQPLERTNELLATSHILVNTSLAEGFPNTFVQAWLRKVAVISLNVDPDNLLSMRGLGILANSLENLIKGLDKLIKQVELRRLIANRANQYALKHHSMDNAKRLVELLEAKAR